MGVIKAVLGVARTPFLVLPVTLAAAGAASSAWDGGLNWIRAVISLIGLLSLHIAVNVLNEVSDMRTGIDLRTERTPFSGGSGTLPAGLMSVRAAVLFGLLNAAIGLAAGVWFYTRIGWPIIPIALLGAVMVLGYTNFLTRIGLGEFAAGLGLGALPVLGTDLVLDGTIGPAGIAACVPAFFMTFNLLLLNEFPDEEADRSGGRRNLVILFGREKAARIYMVAAVAVPVSIFISVALDALPTAASVSAIPSIMLVQPVKWAANNPSGSVPIPALGANVIWNLGTNALMAASLGVAIFIGG